MSGIEKETGSNKVFLKIIEGSLRQAVPAGTPDAVEREWQAGGKTGVSIELVHKAAFGHITEVSFYDGESDGRKFTTLNITLDENEDGKKPVIGVGIGTKYAQDLMKKLPSVDFKDEVRIRPFSYIPEGEDKNVTGVEILQRDGTGAFTKKVNNFFIKQEGEKWIPTNGFPVRPKPYEDQTEEEREIYKIQCRAFLMRVIKEKIAPKVALIENDRGFSTPKTYEQEERMKSPEEVAEGINLDDIPF
jgi:hypothetical protein